MKCAHCGSEIKVGSVYCQVCGKAAQIVPDYNELEDELEISLLDEPKRSEESSKVDNTIKEQQQKKSTKKNTKNNKKPVKNRNVIIYGVVIGLAIVAITVISLSKYHTSFSYQYKLGIKYDEAKDYKAAIIHYENALAADDSSIKVRMKLAKDYEKTESETAAEDILLEAAKLDTKNVDVFKMLIKLYMSHEKYDEINALKEIAGSHKVLQLFDQYVIEVPVFSEAGGEFEDDVKLTLSCSSKSEIYYTIDGSNPTSEDGKLYDGKDILLEDGVTTVKAVCKCDEQFGEVVSQKYDISYQAPDYPLVSPESGTFTSPTNITIEAQEGSSIYYTWDGSVPSEGSAKYEGPIPVMEGNNILSILVVDKHGLCSEVLQCNYKYLP